MKLVFLFSLIAITAAALTGCGDTNASPSPEHATAPENGAQFREGKGVALTPLMAQSIQLQTAEVQEEAISPVFTITMQAMQDGTLASGWLTEDQAAQVRSGMDVELGETKGRVRSVEKAPYVTLGDYEVTVETSEPLQSGTAIETTFRFPAGDSVTTIPQAALLTTAEGTFVYARNDEFYLRTPVETGATSGEKVEIKDGLYTGDEIVTSGVMGLWLAELQVVRGGKACTCGH